MAYFQADVPQQRDQFVQLVLQAFIRRVPGQEFFRLDIQQNEQIDVRFWIQLAAAIAAGRDQRNAFRHCQLLPDKA